MKSPRSGVRNADTLRTVQQSASDQTGSPTRRLAKNPREPIFNPETEQNTHFFPSRVISAPLMLFAHHERFLKEDEEGGHLSVRPDP